PEVNAIPAAVQQKIASSPLDKPLANLSPEETAQIPPGVRNKLNDTSLRVMPAFLGTFVPIGLMGLLLAAMLAADMSTDSSYMLAWGSVIYNDILAPFRKKQLSDRKAILWNRCIVAGIGV